MSEEQEKDIPDELLAIHKRIMQEIRRLRQDNESLRTILEIKQQPHENGVEEFALVLRSSLMDRLDHERQLKKRFEDVAELVRNICRCKCDDSWTIRNIHAPECLEWIAEEILETMYGAEAVR
jgi:hypothetical protein